MFISFNKQMYIENLRNVRSCMDLLLSNIGAGNLTTIQQRDKFKIYAVHILIKWIQNKIFDKELHNTTLFLAHLSIGIYSKTVTNVPYEILTKCCYYLSGSKSNVAARESDWLTYKKLIILFCFKVLSRIYKITLFKLEVCFSIVTSRFLLHMVFTCSSWCDIREPVILIRIFYIYLSC